MSNYQVRKGFLTHLISQSRFITLNSEIIDLRVAIDMIVNAFDLLHLFSHVQCIDHILIV